MNGLATRSGQFRRLSQPSSSEVAHPTLVIHRELLDFYGNEIARAFQRHGILFGASAPPETTRIDSFTIPGDAQLIVKLPNFELNGASFMQVLPNSEWAHEHNFCIALIPSSAGTTATCWFAGYLSHATDCHRGCFAS
jgi:hypothetical protein